MAVRPVELAVRRPVDGHGTTGDSTVDHRPWTSPARPLRGEHLFVVTDHARPKSARCYLPACDVGKPWSTPQATACERVETPILMYVERMKDFTVFAVTFIAAAISWFEAPATM